MKAPLLPWALLLGATLVGGFVGPVALWPARSARPAADARVVMLAKAKKKKGGKAAARGPAVAAVTQEVEAVVATAAPVAATLEDDGEIFPIPAGAWERRRIPTGDVSFNAILAAAAAASSDDDSLGEFVNINRDLLDYRWLYRLTGELLLAQNTGDDARSEELRELRARIIKLNQRFDAPLFKQIAEAEGRLGQVLGLYAVKQAPPAAEVAKAAGQTGTQVFAFWIVVVAAIAAWEAKLGVPSIVAMAKAKLEELNEVLGAIEEQPELLAAAQLTHLAPLVAQPNQALPAAAHADARAAFDGLGLSAEEAQQLVRKLGCLYCQASRHAFQAYNPLVQKTAALYDVLLHGSVQPLSALDIKTPERKEYTSNLVKLAIDAEGTMAMEGRPIELFW